MSEHLNESTVAQLVAGELSPEQAEAAHAHAAECRECERFVAELARVAVTAPAPAPDTAELARGASVGRFIVLERLGSGGMGVVHAAYDPELDRRVALKLLRSRRDADVRARLLREAQAAARLAHPNVASVFEIGELSDVVYLAMELVDGLTLGGWLREQRTWQDIIDVFVQAGRGLAAAHAAGVIHRDFKPDNVLVGRDGRVRVVDFGLARGAESDEPEQPPALESAARSLSDRLTRTGALLGTPRYMAPEQLTGGEITPAADQFAFCVALYQALYGTVPFRGEHIGEIADHVLANEIVPPVTSRGPLALRRAIVRGLGVDPAGRHPSMPALLRELERARGVRRRRTLAVAGALGAAALAAGGFAVAARFGSAAACAGSGDRIDAVWSDARKARVHAAFTARRLPYGELAWRGVAARLDAYAAAWSAMRGDACAATRVRGEQSAQLLDLRMTCLDERLAELDAFAGVLETADAETVQHAVDGADRLPALAPCADRAALAAAIRPPAAPIAARVAQVGGDVTKASALERVGKRGPALAAAERACTGVEQLAYAPLTARCRHVVGALAESAAGDHARAAKLLAEAVAQAVAGNDHERAGDAALALARVLGDSEHRDEAGRWLAVADGVGGRLADRTALDAGLAELRGILAIRSGKPADALPQFERLLALRERLDPKGGLAVANAHVSMGHALVQLARFPDAERHYRRALAVIEEVSGAQHPNLCPVLDGLGQLAFVQGKAAEGLPYLERSLAITRATLPAGHPELVTALANVGAALANAGKLDRALAMLEEARSMVTAGDRAARALVLTNLVLVYQLRGDHARALPTAEQTLALERDLKGAEHPDTALAQFNLGDALLSNGQPREAAVEFRGALAIWERVLPADHPYLATAHTALRDAEQRSARQLGQRRDQRR